jgi:hypothetical protein
MKKRSKVSLKPSKLPRPLASSFKLSWGSLADLLQKNFPLQGSKPTGAKSHGGKRKHDPQQGYSGM